MALEETNGTVDNGKAAPGEVDASQRSPLPDLDSVEQELAQAAPDAAEPSPEKGSSHSRTLLVGDRDRSYVLYVPSGYDHEKPIPLVLVFHGRLGTGQLMEQMTHFSKLAERGFIAVYPDGIGRSWNAGHGVGPAETAGVDDVGFIVRLLEELSREFRVDQRRIYAAGMSNGGILVYRLVCELPGKFAAVASVAGPLAPEIASGCAEGAPVSVLHIHGTADRIAPWDGGKTSSGGQILSVDATIQKWSDRAKCAGPPVLTFEKGAVACYFRRNCEDGIDVELCRVEGGGHSWPGSEPSRLLESTIGPTNQDLNASEMIWNFFARHTLPDGPRKHAFEEDASQRSAQGSGASDR